MALDLLATLAALTLCLRLLLLTGAHFSGDLTRDLRLQGTLLPSKRKVEYGVQLLLRILFSSFVVAPSMLTGTSLLPLQRADGSATYSAHGFSVLAAVNGPVEVQRRDELPDEATVDVVVRPAAGVGSMTAPLLECHRTKLTPTRCPGTPSRVDS